MEVRFIRHHPAKESDITVFLQKLYNLDWRVVSHAQDSHEYSFVLDREKKEGRGYVKGMADCEGGVCPLTR
jgi:hypothetical protein